MDTSSEFETTPVVLKFIGLAIYAAFFFGAFFSGGHFFENITWWPTWLPSVVGDFAWTAFFAVQTILQAFSIYYDWSVDARKEEREETLQWFFWYPIMAVFGIGLLIFLIPSASAALAGTPPWAIVIITLLIVLIVIVWKKSEN